jgi:hypothetical protein
MMNIAPVQNTAFKYLQKLKWRLFVLYIRQRNNFGAMAARQG